MIADEVRSGTAPSGRQVEIAVGEQCAWVVEVGGGLRAYSARGREMLDGYASDEMCSSARGQCLVPWPNRIRDGRYEFAGMPQQLPLTEPERQNAIHGLTRWANWTIAERAADGVTMEHLLHPQPGYPHTLRLAVEYRLDSDGLTVRTTATNVGASACPYGAGAHPYLTVGTPTVDSVVLQAPGRTRLTSDERGIPIGVEPWTGPSTTSGVRGRSGTRSWTRPSPISSATTTGGHACISLRRTVRPRRSGSTRATGI